MHHVLAHAAILKVVAKLPVAIQAQQAQLADWDSYILPIHCAVRVLCPRPVVPIPFILRPVRQAEGVARTCSLSAQLALQLSVLLEWEVDPLDHGP